MFVELTVTSKSVTNSLVLAACIREKRVKRRRRKKIEKRERKVSKG